MSASDLSAWLLEQIAKDERAIQHAEDIGESFTPFGGDDLRAECEAKRKIITAYIEHAEFAALRPGSALQSPDETAAWESCVRLLAEPFAERPGYREEWRP